MPLYEYQCAKCGKKSEFIQNFKDPHETKCPRCGGALKKLLSSPAVQFKGSGFYATDYGKAGGSKGEEAKGEKSEKSEKGEKSEEKKDSSKGEEGKSGGSESKGDPAGERKGDSSKGERDSSRGKKDGGGETAAAPSSPAKRSPPVPSKKNSRDSK